MIEYPTLNAFYAERPERRTSGEADYGVCWRRSSRDWPLWRVSYIHATGEIYAVQMTAQEGPVILLGTVPPDPDDDEHRGTYYRTLDKLLTGWADPAISRFDLAWVKRRLTNAMAGNGTPRNVRQLVRGDVVIIPGHFAGEMTIHSTEWEDDNHKWLTWTSACGRGDELFPCSTKVILISRNNDEALAGLAASIRGGND